MSNPTSGFEAQVVRASAGTGKTTELSTRFIALLAAGESADRILATTFTKKAAGEIQQRLFARLAEAALNPRAAKAIAEKINQPAFSREKAAEILARVIAGQHRLRICTLDSFFIQIALSFGLEMGLMPGWRISDSATDRQLYREAVQAVCRGSTRDFITLLRLLSQGDLKRQVHERIEFEVGDLYELYRQTREPAWKWLKPPPRLAKDELARRREALSRLPLPKTKQGTPNKYWENAVSEAVRLVDQGRWRQFIERGLGKKIFDPDGDLTFGRAVIGPEVVEIYMALLQQAKAELLLRLAGQNEAAYDLLKTFEVEFEKQRQISHTLSFGDVKHKLAQAALMQQLEEVYYRLDSQIHHLLLDEFQDTSGEEWQVLKPVAEEILSKADGEFSFFCVGDVKQAIYGWRGGVAEIFESLEGAFPQLSNPVTRETSYRCAQPVIETVNQVFAGLSANAAFADYPERQAAAKEWSGRFKTHSSGHPDAPGYAALIAARPGEEQSLKDALFRQTALLAKGILADAPQSSLGILMRRNSAVRRMIYELKRDEIGIFASEEGGNPLTDSPAVSLILSLLKLIDHPGDTIARFQVAASPLGAQLGFADFRDDLSACELSRRGRALIEGHGYGAAICQWLELLKNFCGRRDWQRLLQLSELSFAYQAPACLRTRDFIEYVELNHVQDPSAAQVRVMTVHQSKGLEFDAVILPELDAALLRMMGQGMLRYRADPVAAPVRISRAVPRLISSFDPALDQMYQQTAKEELKEALSVLYVAMTRAKSALYMVIPPLKDSAKLPFSYAGILQGALCQNPASQETALLYEHGSRQWFAAAPAKEPPAEPAAPVEPAVQPIVFAAGSGRRRRGLIR